MSAVVGAPSTRVEGQTKGSTGRRRSQIVHYYWLANGKAAQEMGVQVRHFCGTWGPPPNSHVVITQGGRLKDLKVLPPEKRDCKRCIRSLHASIARLEARK